MFVLNKIIILTFSELGIYLDILVAAPQLIYLRKSEPMVVY